MGNRWEANAGENITLSIILYPGFVPVRAQFELNEAVAMALRDCVAKYVEKPVQVKWPNDVYVEERKIAGILIPKYPGRCPNSVECNRYWYKRQPKRFRCRATPCDFFSAWNQSFIWP